MSGKRGAGALYESVTFQAQGSTTDGAGGVLTSFSDVFSCRAAFFHQRGGEGVLAGRLEGRHTIVIRIRSSAVARTVTTDFRVVDKRLGTIYAVRDVTPSDDRLYIDFLCESGVAA
jgi:SPP1 family predicted phage head-tail adaptor